MPTRRTTYIHMTLSSSIVGLFFHLLVTIPGRGGTRSAKLVDPFDGRRDDKDPDVVALWIDGKDEKTRPAAVVSQGRPDQNFTVLKGDLDLFARWLFALGILLTIYIARVAGKVPHQKDGLQVFQEDLCPLTVGPVRRKEMKPVFVGKEIMGVTL